MKHITLTVESGSLPRFTTLLQSGIYLEVNQGTSIGDLLFALPGFSVEYVKSRVQTIFLNGLPADNLEQHLWGQQVVLAISAAMPGLAGAIFRKGGVHSSLRTETATEPSGVKRDDQPVQVRLKLFNMIAVEKGVELLEKSCVVASVSLKKFLAYRPPLLAAIQTITLNGKDLGSDTVTSHLESDDKIILTIRNRT
ncbi:hypothetical protein UWK_01374 [Desulfocapsa sulfexigens DSM 10523]|uniref:Uncharacterized protein n=1 Tax=Desulfocapsa sulfexigens (strain DSM 10523 / SB164P1) TaxID=1167006 RepID=M1PE08_DESSD|nr:hypothetical protein [Desulfocapsa sulfexigens]AGF77935.1 hypothetical protein UWK_01374 [Desulfocapsa sulfexigens DSM 10523]